VRVVLTPSAQDDLRDVYSFHVDRGSASADHVVGTILKAINGLAAFPHLGRAGVVPGTRERIVMCYPYRIVYRIVDDVIEVARVLHTAREWP
jgi:toxin ParE1/3/4